MRPEHVALHGWAKLAVVQMAPVTRRAAPGVGGFTSLRLLRGETHGAAVEQGLGGGGRMHYPGPCRRAGGERQRYGTRNSSFHPGIRFESRPLGHVSRAARPLLPAALPHAPAARANWQS